jgi:NADPH:quinone reductase
LRALRFHQFGPPARVLRLEEPQLPQPGPGQVRLRLTHRPIHPSDLLTISGDYGRLPQLPATPGFEAVGRVDALGEGVTDRRLGERVIPLGTAAGTWRESVLADATRLLPVPEAVSDQAAAQFVVNPVTAWVMVEEVLAMRPGEWLLQTAAGSALGRIVIQLGRLRGFRTINLVRRREQVTELQALGADVVFCTADDNIVEQVRSLTGGTGARGALEAVGGPAAELAMRCLRPGGQMVLYGMLSGETFPVHNGEMLFRGLTLRGFWLSHWFRSASPDRVASTLAGLMQLLAEGRLVLPVEAEYDLGDYLAAVAHAERPGRQGKVLLVG